MLMKNKWFIIMVWLTILVVFGVFETNRAIRASSGGYQTVEFANSPLPVTVTDPANDNISIVPMGNRTVWMIDRSSMTVSVISQDKSGNFHLVGAQSYNQK